MSAQIELSNQAVPVKFFAREFAKSAQDGGIYGVKEIVPLIGLPASDHIEPEHIDDVVAFGIAFATFKAAMVDTVKPNEYMRRTAVVLRNSGSVAHQTNAQGLSHCANGLFISPGLMTGNVRQYDERLHGSHIADPEKFAGAMQAALVNAAASEGVPVIIPEHGLEQADTSQLLMRLQAHGYDVIHRSRLPEPESVVT